MRRGRTPNTSQGKWELWFGNVFSFVTSGRPLSLQRLGGISVELFYGIWAGSPCLTFRCLCIYHETASEMPMNFNFPEKEINMLWETLLLFLVIFLKYSFCFLLSRLYSVVFMDYVLTTYVTFTVGQILNRCLLSKWFNDFRMIGVGRKGRKTPAVDNRLKQFRRCEAL